MLTISDLSLRIAGRLLLDHADLSLPTGAKAGLVGRNGAGKTTLFRAIRGEMASESGRIDLPKGARIGGVSQEVPGTDESLIDIVLKADTERATLLEESETATDPMRIAEIQTRLVDIDAHSAEARAAAILSGLGFDQEAQQRPAKSFSGGWRMRVALASVLFSQPDLLLLDEPTNYLDLEGTLWLENYLARYPHTVLLISHDRDLLNRAVSSIVHLEGKKLTFWRGGYDQFSRQRAEKAELAAKAAEKQDARKKELQAFVDRFRAKASKARQAQSRLKMLEKMDAIDMPVDEHVAPFRFAEPQKEVASPAIRLEETSVGYEPGKPILRGLNLRIDADDRIALLGANGNGKSTFAKLLADRLKAEEGTMTVAPKLKVAMFAQHQMDDLHPNESAIEHVRAMMPQAPEAKVRARVAQMGLPTEKMMTAAKDLSGGEKARLLMGLATFEGPNLLILDEPTNHLDIDSRRALTDALNAFSGAVILISHDRSLVESTADRLWLVHDGTVAPYEGDMEDYKALILSLNRTSKGEKSKPSQSKAEIRREAAKKREELKVLAKKIKEFESLMGKAQKRIQAIEAELAEGDIYESDPARATKLAKERSDASVKLAETEAAWLEASESYETSVNG
ncbi:ABC-F family ATP-binding cassette domain-containing protein [Notoacmeibacter ruber]|uniref:ABC transporter ATP-binding protein n=1 Tax=Notoacmeibacter ruber TaxID=2670375 RepID=A0A3L7JB34_9HYPH|nr:ABC-F family ATP-binding cassette domain-containing protein [Notoacmeibacter ruber]RLQ87649.1 ABC transporter ATP-binding protein [Notoacmeibacter ruber]